MLTLHRRHLDDCPHRDEGRTYTKCSCPVWCDGFVKGRRIRKSLDTVNWARARRHADELEGIANGETVRKTLLDAADAFLSQFDADDVSSSTKKYRRILRLLTAFLATRGVTTVDRIILEHLDAYRQSRPLSAFSWSKELQKLRTFFTYCAKRKWCDGNPAKDMEMPRKPKAKPRAPYTSEEITRIIAACQTFGKGPYERLRAHAMILLMRKYALRISDVATLEKSRVAGNDIRCTAQKNGEDLWFPLYPDVRQALDVLPHPKGAQGDCKYFFWSGLGSREEHIKTVGRSLNSVFVKSGVERASAHRFRHTLATELLVKGGSLQDAANILGDTPAIIEQHYAKYSPEYKRRVVELLNRVHGTPTAHEENEPVSSFDTAFGVVPGVGLEKTEGEKEVLKTFKLLNSHSANMLNLPLEALKPQFNVTPMARGRADEFRRSPGNSKKKAQHGAGPHLVKLGYRHPKPITVTP